MRQHPLSNRKNSLDFIMDDVHLLRDLSEKDKRLDTLKLRTMKASMLLQGTIHDKYFQRQHNCANYLSFVLTSDGMKLRQTYYATKTGKKVAKIRFCRAPGCILCDGRRASCWQCRAFKAAPRIIADYAKCTLLFLTLTLKNPLIDDLSKCLKAMQGAWDAMTREYKVVKNKKGKILRTEGNSQWQALGWLKSLEITKSGKDYCHPHYHIMLLMPPRYFLPGGGYMTTEQWGQMWAKYMKLEYQPITDIRQIKGNWKQAIPEICKYTTKPSDLLDSQDWFVKYISQIKRVRRTELGGCFRKYFRDDDGQENLINFDEEETLDDVNLPVLDFIWAKRDLLGNELWNYQALGFSHEGVFLDEVLRASEV
jgi:plasmid rolling circle replication initiator protein Rep